MILDFLFGKKKQENPPPSVPQPDLTPIQATQIKQAPAPGTSINFSPDLVLHLEADHQKLLQIFTSIGDAFSVGDLPVTTQRLEDFRGALQSHLLTESVRLYIYLEHALAQDAESHALIHEFRHEMEGIGKAVLEFLGKYHQLAVQPNLVASFGNDLSAVGKVLVERIQREESTLYPLYLPAY
ncbi:MAG: hemerythrin domain-containing protein [Glaciimonas sp.]|nr:hemerythrin domain-containing protein [Glaciimonas sp.]